MKRIVVIGGGVSGMSAGIYARINGFDTVICEKHSTVGGNLCGWTRDGYHIDNCIHWLTGTNPHSEEYRMWNELGAIRFTAADMVVIHFRFSEISINLNSGCWNCHPKTVMRYAG